ncbi:MAG: hypothetical protein FRX48_06776 [Lasallia pustulata]|uniref:Uncharacterized protein n=1 Tax=Lasallia pustulata TaxID=136370 RepID=A0A5M8PIJ2_9LECA|nr:MAG: hypothetical protein FRX48_06776 [Lasallia pustulata]
MENGDVATNSSAGVRRNRDEEAVKKFTNDNGNGGLVSTGHKRSLSGSILSKLSFLRPGHGQVEDAVEIPHQDGSADVLDIPQSPRSAMAAAVYQQKKTRKRKGSLRKTALLGTGKLRLEGRERRGSILDQVDTVQDDQKNGVNDNDDGPAPSPRSPTKSENISSSGQSYSTHSVGASIVDHGERASGSRIQTRDQENQMVGHVTSPTLGDASTTDEDDPITLPRSSPIAVASSALKKVPSSGSDSYFSPQTTSVLRKRSNRAKSPLATLPIETVVATEDWDYSETEWWGWVVLIVTWVVFVVGMGSCFDVWSWAWDVGETPYAPPELEDDPTLPIVGYYPALIILTTVMAWVWVVVAWVGMKYFKHAKISGDDE